MAKRKLLPEGMGKRMPTIVVWCLATAMTTFTAPELAATTALMAFLGVGFTVLLVMLWGPRTRPRRNAFWFLVHIVLFGAVIALAAARPVLGAVTAIPVTLLWIHDSPASPTAMLSWGVTLVLFQPDFWQSIEAEQAWSVAVAVLIMIAAAQMERNRLAARQFAQAGFLYSLVRFGMVAAITMLFIAGREGLRAVNVFINLGIDASGTSGKITMLAFIAVSLAVAAALFRVRPDKGKPLVIADASPAKGSQEREQGERLDFDELEDGPRPSASRQPRKATRRSTGKREAPAERRSPTPAPRAKGRAEKEKAAPGELDFD